MLERIRKILSNISRGSSHGQKSPHKLIFLLTLAKLCEKTDIENHFTFTDVEKEFEGTSINAFFDRSPVCFYLKISK